MLIKAVCGYYGIAAAILKEPDMPDSRHQVKTQDTEGDREDRDPYQLEAFVYQGNYRTDKAHMAAADAKRKPKPIIAMYEKMTNAASVVRCTDPEE